jgi:hypothetical protein
LTTVLHHARDVVLSGKTPLVFFDEFDAWWDNRPFGWLRYFLAPMQDGRFKDGESLFNVGPAIFVFVGGINHSFDMLNGRMRNREFIEAKGPDFVSRLRGHLDVLGITQTRDEDITYIIRRATLFRKKLEEFAGSVCPKDGPAQIDEDVVRAFLKVQDFKHGVRSMESIIRMSHLNPATNWLHRKALPLDNQLEMHVSVKEFVKAAEKSKK